MLVEFRYLHFQFIFQSPAPPVRDIRVIETLLDVTHHVLGALRFVGIAEREVIDVV